MNDLDHLAHDLPVSRRDFLRLSALLTGAIALPGLARAANPDDPVRIGYLPITDASPLLVAHARQLFEQQGLNVEAPRLFRSWAQIVEAFMAGQVNVVHLLSPMTIWARYGSQFPAKVVAWNHMSGSALTVAPTIQSVKDLGGKKVAVPFWYSIHNVVLQHLLRENGLTVVTKPADSLKANEVALSIMAPADMGPALANGAIAGFIVAEPFNAAAETNGIGRVLRFTGDVWREHACCVVTMHERDLKDRPEWSQKVVNAVVNAQHWLRDNRKEGAQLLSKDAPGKYTPFPPAVLERVLVPNAERSQQYVREGAIRHPEWKDERIEYQPYPFPSYTEQLVKLLKNTQVEGNNQFLSALDPAFVARDLVDDRFVRKSIATLGGLKAFGLPEKFTRSETIVA
ncbi:ABC transporter substrate-binding protein [Rhodocyclus tenuis]|uniref:NitT/TauT family transport system substrate-binding protein n=1 Tax=Rhodocyclus tenuis TaxID=1066 RepID=A0A840GD87_RHOTE|nr:ABC transporter substrate-binding protein [Rhodocyclus tenuis]MBB4248598.1 NitT/TauT family transport system substrate-binding protein [Rhodocyclus tenuis]